MAKDSSMPDVGVLPSSGGESIDKTGIKDSGYLTKKGTPSGNVKLNHLPPGMVIEDQDIKDIHEQPMKMYQGGLSYPGDGW